VVLLFGVGRISKVFGELGSGIRAFRQGLQGDKKDAESGEETIEDKPKSE
jgi:sec-independent protein translocase protein TatA